MTISRRRFFSRRRFLHLAAGAAAFPMVSRIARAQTFPARPITLIVPFGAGGPTDVMARIAAEHMSRTLGQRLIVENVAGAGGTTAAARVMRANPDGYTIQIGHMGTHAAAPAFYPNLAYRPDADFAPIGMVALTAYVIAANKSFPPNDLNEFIAYAKANHQRLNMGHAGVGSNTHLTGLLLNAILGLRPALVPFNSAAAATNAMIAGHVRDCALDADHQGGARLNWTSQFLKASDLGCSGRVSSPARRCPAIRATV